MKNTKFTKDNWYADTDTNFGGKNSIVVSEEKGVIVKLNQASFDDDEEMKATAKLMAAAPDLLEALKVCYASLCTYGSHPIIEKQVTNAINKAIN